MSDLPTKTNGQTGISGSLEISSIDDLSRIADMMAKSGFFDDAVSAHQAGVKIMAGMELGIPPVASVRGIDIIDGNTALSSGVVAALIKQHPHYSYKVIEATDERCEIAFYEDDTKLGTASFTMGEAENFLVKERNGKPDLYLADKRNWQNSPSDMLFARAISRGRRRFCADVGLGKLYTAEEMRADGEPQVVEAEVVDEDASVKTETNGKPEPNDDLGIGEPTDPEDAGDKTPEGNDYDDLPFEPPGEPELTDVRRFHTIGTELYDDWDAKRTELVEAITDGRTDSASDLTAEEIQKLIAGMEEKMGEKADQMIG